MKEYVTQEHITGGVVLTKPDLNYWMNILFLISIGNLIWWKHKDRQQRNTTCKSIIIELKTPGRMWKKRVEEGGEVRGSLEAHNTRSNYKTSTEYRSVGEDKRIDVFDWWSIVSIDVGCSIEALGVWYR